MTGMEAILIFGNQRTKAQPGDYRLLGDNNGNDNSSMYFVFYKTYESISVYAKVFLQGPYSGGVMNTTLQSSSLIPLSQPYKLLHGIILGRKVWAAFPQVQ